MIQGTLVEPKFCVKSTSKTNFELASKQSKAVESSERAAEMKAVLKEKKRMLQIFKLDFKDLQGVIKYERERVNSSINDLKNQQVSQALRIVVLQNKWAEIILGIETIKIPI